VTSAEAAAVHDASETGEQPALRLLTLNAHQGFGALRRRRLLAGLREALRASCADLVFLQEVGADRAPDEGASEVAQANYETLADQVWPRYAYGQNAVTSGGHQGNALLSKFPIVRWDNVDISVDRAEPRGLLHCVIDVSSDRGPLHTVCVHLGLKESHRRCQVDRLLEYIGDAVPADAPLIVAGDFNDWRGRVHRRLAAESDLHEIFACTQGAPARTFPARWPLLALDRIYVRHLGYRPLPLVRGEWSTLSDHLPLAGVVTLSRGASSGPSTSSLAARDARPW